MNRASLKAVLACSIVAAALSLGAFASPASAGAFCSNVLLQAGGSDSFSNTCIHGGSHRIFSDSAYATSSAMSCVGGTYHSYQIDWYSSPPCCPTDGCYVSWTPNGPQVYPALHNHSTHQGRFQGDFTIQ